MRFLGMGGVVDESIEEIVSDLASTVAKLETLAARKRDEVTEQEAVMVEAQAAAEVAAREGARARSVAAKIAAILE